MKDEGQIYKKPQIFFLPRDLVMIFQIEWWF